MEKWRADYLVFSTLDEDVASTILGWADLDEGSEEFPEDSLYSLSLSGEFESGGGLEVAHRSSPDGEVVILRLVEDEADQGS